MEFNKEELYRKLLQLAGSGGSVRMDAPMKEYTTFRVGGPADLLVEPGDVNSLVTITTALKENGVPYYLLGNGSNILVRDEGFRGVIIKIGRKMSNVSVTGNVVEAEAGAMLSYVSKEAAARSLAGMEFASGIPGSIGGAVFMNAGAYGGEMKQIVTSVTAAEQDGSIRVYSADECDFGYRHSAFADNGSVVLSARIELEKGDKAQILAYMNDLSERRRSKQPLNLPSAGSTFKRPEGHYAGQLIDEAGMRGASYGGAQVSPKHAGFVVNNGNATADDILQLIKLVQMRVKETSGVDLETEVRIIGG
ncbi:MAG: UDP-N-acetylmuramate dehydrogenase [Anaerovoracaceae bacterium]|nr:UDP-N-acetylmuramate dehydrogenase [Bacillota bacterium]MDY2671079.1 UDP-N-acetylmuramate dehydrogenase [Anaerovoracaceae bacterium]